MLFVPCWQPILRDGLESVSPPHAAVPFLVGAAFISSLRIIKIVEEKIQILGRLECQVLLDPLIVLYRYLYSFLLWLSSLIIGLVKSRHWPWG